MGLFGWCLAVLLPWQAGDQPGEAQPALPADLLVPDAPPLSAEQALASFDLPEGLRIELVAAEPLVVDPVHLAFDPEGRLWIAEMRGFMPNVDGTGEEVANGVIAVLRDTDGDGRMDARQEFLDGLVLPRGVQPYQAGVLVLAPPDLLYCRDTDDDGRADERTVVDTGFTAGLWNPEHAINGLLPTLDNWVRCAGHAVRYRRKDGVWERESVAGGGQWGIAQDDEGRIFYNTNSEPLRGDAIASRYAVRNPSHGRGAGVNRRVVDDRSVRPGRVTPGINRGYREGMLRDGYLTQYTAACGPLIYRGTLLPGLDGVAFVCEPAGNLIAAYRLAEDALGRVSGTPLRGAHDFLTSRDERFRPVQLANGPDGALYVVDFYRGIIQHRNFVTSWLRGQIEERGLAEPLGLGRIWRIRAEDLVPAGEGGPPPLGAASLEELVEELGSPAGWRRDTAQRLLVERARFSARTRELLAAVVRESPSRLARIHALWTLRGLGVLQEATVAEAVLDPDPGVAVHAMRTAEALLGRPGGELAERFLVRARAGPARVRWQALLSLSESHSDAPTRALRELLADDASLPEYRSAVLTGLSGRELDFLRGLLRDPRWRSEADGRGAFCKLLARAIVREGRGDRIEALLELVAGEDDCTAWQRGALLQGILDGRPKGPKGGPAPIPLLREPTAFLFYKDARADSVPGLVHDVAGWLSWPGARNRREVSVRPLTAAEAASFERGRELFARNCVSCHHPSGRGEPGKAPPLRHSPWVLGSEEVLGRIVLQGMGGPLEIDGQEWNQEMPAFVAGDADIADLLTYLRREWGHGAEPLTAEQIAGIRAASAERDRPWTAAELAPFQKD